MDIHQELKKAVSYHQAGQLDQAKDIYVRIYEVDPRLPDPLHLLGVIAYQTGEYHTAVELINRAINIDSDNPAYYNNLGNAYKENGMLDDALASYRKAIDLRPDYAEAYFSLGNAFQQLDRFNDAIFAYQSALKLRPDMAIAHNNLGVALFNLGQIDLSFVHYQQALEIEPGYFEAYNNAGNVLKRQTRYREAIRWYLKAIELNPNSSETYASMGFAFQSLGQLDDAMACLQKSLEINPNYGEAYNDLGTLYRELGKLERALACFQKSAILKPKNPEAFNNMGIVYRQQEQFGEAISCYQKALQLNPDFSDAHYNLGSAYWKCGQSEKSLSSYGKAIQLNPDHAFAHNLLISRLQQTCAWDKLEKPVAKLKQLTKAALENNKLAAEMPFLTFALSDDPSHNFRIAKSWADEIKAKASAFCRSSKTYEPFSFGNRGEQKSRLTVGYLTADFQNHATAHLMRSFFGYHDRNAFKINAYSYGKNDSSHYREKIERDCDKFVDICKLNHYEAAKEIYKDEVDILVDLKGYTEGNRLEICAHQSAPIQVAWLGFPGTIGADFMDYIITDRIITPLEHAPYFSEKFVYMPHTYQVNDCHQEIADTKYRRSDFELPEDGFVFCSFNEPYKIEPVMFDVWMKVLRQIPNSVLWLIRKGQLTVEHLKREANRRGVASDRLIYANKLPKAEHLARLQLADLFLDTRKVNGHTTTSDALWAGVPVITLQGKHLASRVSSSLLSAVGLPELISQSLSEYEALAVRLANHPVLLKNIKEKLAQNRLQEPLFDTARFSKNLEKAYKMMWRIFINGEKPRQIAVERDEDN